jgi:hypothetical protein
VDTATELADFLATVDVLRDLSADERRRLVTLGHERIIPAGGRLLEQGRSNGSLFVLRSGQLVVKALVAIDTIQDVRDGGRDDGSADRPGDDRPPVSNPSRVGRRGTA